MAQIRNKTESKTKSWTEKARFRVGATVIYNNYYWTNITGHNTEPGVSNDWLVGGYYADITSLSPYASIDGYLVKKAGVDNNNIEINDICQGEWSDGDYAIFKVNALPYTNANNVSFYVKSAP